jgi:hypothetical protein
MVSPTATETGSRGRKFQSTLITAHSDVPMIKRVDSKKSKQQRMTINVSVFAKNGYVVFQMSCRSDDFEMMLGAPVFRMPKVRWITFLALFYAFEHGESFSFARSSPTRRCTGIIQP